jgi:endo-1,4-beta-xylanase
MLSRRKAVAAIAATGAACALGTEVSCASSESLESAAARGGRFFGSAVRIDQLNTEQDLRQAVLRECAYLVPEIDLNWNQVEPEYGELSFAKMDDLSAFAIGNRKRVRGHTLLWHLGTPQWAEEMLRERQDWNLIARYFGSVIPRYGDVIGQWEVVNEPLDPGHRTDGLRESVFLEAFGPDYIGRALAQARTFAPRAQLMVNEYGFEYDLPEERERRYFMLKLLERLRNQGAPIDGLGMQGHLDLRKGHVSQSSIASFLHEVTAMGLAVVVSELDVKESEYVAAAQERDQLVGDEVRRYLEVVLGFRNVEGVVSWGLSDRHTWLAVTESDYARFPGAWADGTGPGFNRGLPFDSSMQKTPMYYAIRDTLLSARPSNQNR